jgi:hypothetical protein
MSAPGSSVLGLEEQPMVQCNMALNRQALPSVAEYKTFEEMMVPNAEAGSLWASVVAVCAVTGTLGMLYLPLVVN